MCEDAGTAPTPQEGGWGHMVRWALTPEAHCLMLAAGWPPQGERAEWFPTAAVIPVFRRWCRDRGIACRV